MNNDGRVLLYRYLKIKGISLSRAAVAGTC